MFVPYACNWCPSPASFNTFWHSATYLLTETPTPIGTTHKSTITFMLFVSLDFAECRVESLSISYELSTVCFARKLESRTLMLPKLIVFDLDFTLWDCGGTWCDCLSPPFRWQNEQVIDRASRQVRLYDDVISILDHCDDHSIPMAIASRTEQPAWARELIEMLLIHHRFAFAEIYPSSKLRHFAALRESSGFEYSSMVFFDDEMRNISDVSSLGVTSIHVSDGITADLFHSALRTFETLVNARGHQD